MYKNQICPQTFKNYSFQQKKFPEHYNKFLLNKNNSKHILSLRSKLKSSKIVRVTIKLCEKKKILKNCISENYFFTQYFVIYFVRIHNSIYTKIL